ncbi:MAG: DNA mismatch repair endonuclease MutL [Oscillospiraceae bacterium]|nr:DNA mismatch repair endonuclease MutL [Oscillospiraceae bacterium]
MPKILELEQHVADLIAAGEVVQRPASVVKELLENSIDAGAGIITVEISSGGMTYIRVTDDGCGIAADEAKTAFLRHATSKLRDADGLAAIGTLGFRGEALAAIAAVSRIELMTREHGANEGIALTLEAGEVVNMSPVGCPEGTTIIVRDLFFNTPARQKFMKSDRAEASSISSVVLRCALSRPDISIRFIKDGKTEYHTPGDSKVESCIYSLLGRDIESGFIRAEASDETVSVSGYVSSPASARGNRSYQFFFVNGRVIRSVLLQSALEQAYKNNLPSGRFPSCVLFITIKPGDVDVNVHPAKTEIKFVSEKQVFDGVYYAAFGAINKEREKIAGMNGNEAEGRQLTVTDIIEPVGTQGTGGKAHEYKDGNAADETFKAMRVDDFRIARVTEPSVVYKSSKSPQLSQKFATPDNSMYDYSEFTGFMPSVPPYRVIGEALNVYIIVEYNDSVWFIDKHAAHERIHFDALKNNSFESMSEALITPVICRPGHEGAALLLENSGFLDKLGFTVESFGEDTIAVRHIPAEIDIGDTESVLSEICDLLKHGGVAESSKTDSILKSIACKAAIKAGRSSGVRELESLTAKVMSGEVSLCPHGRPVLFEITKSALDKGFGRL